MSAKWLARSVDIIPWQVRDIIKKVPIISSLQRLLVARYLKNAAFIYKISAGPAKGLNFPIKLPDDKLYWTGTWEKQITECIYSNINTGIVSYDIGSHRGFMAGIMALAGSKKVYCFEPNPENLKHLIKLCTLNQKLDLNVLEYAVSNKDGHAEFSVMPETSMGKLTESSFQSDVAQDAKISVTVRSLDSLLEHGEIEAPGFIKIDVEGAELLVLEGAKNTIEKYFPVFVIELHTFELAHECRNYLTGHGYITEIIQKDIDLNQASTFKVCHLLAKKNA